MNFIKKIATIMVLVCAGIFLAACDDEETALHRIVIEVNLQADGSAEISEVREMSMHDYSEMYITLTNLQDSELLDFSVKSFEPEKNWDSDDSREEKTGKYGILEIDEGYELVWGVGEYGDKIYEPQYALSDVVRQLKDGQALFWNFDTFSMFETDDIVIQVNAPFELTEDSVHYKGFGIEGDIFLENGSLYMIPSETFTDDHALTILMQFPNNPFSSLNTQVDQTLAEQDAQASAGSSYNGEAPMTFLEKMMLAGFLILMGILVIGGITFAIVLARRKEAAGQLKMGKAKREEEGWQASAKVPNYEGELAELHLLLHSHYGDAGSLINIYHAYLMEWANDRRVIMQGEEELNSGDKPEEDYLGLVTYPIDIEKWTVSFSEYVAHPNEFEDWSVKNALWLMLLEMADEDGIVDSENFEKWIEKNEESLEKLVNYLSEYSRDKLHERGYLIKDQINVWGGTYDIEIGTEKGRQLVKEIDQVVQFFDQLTANEQIMMIDGQIDELMVWGALLNELEDFNEEIAERYPNIWQKWSLNYPYYAYYPYFMLHQQHYHHAMTNSSGYSSGTTSSTSFGGGVGAGGGGGGGAR